MLQVLYTIVVGGKKYSSSVLVRASDELECERDAQHFSRRTVVFLSRGVCVPQVARRGGGAWFGGRIDTV